MIRPVDLLLIEDSELDAELVVSRLKRDGLELNIVRRVQTETDMRAALAERRFDVILSDYSLPSFSGAEALALARAEVPDTPFLIISGALGEDTAVDMLRAGATDYVLKTRLDRLASSVRRAIAEAEQGVAKRRTEEELARKAEELALANERLTATNFELERFAYVSSHDLQEPLRRLANYAQLLGDNLRGKLDDKSERYLATVIESASRMHVLIRDLLIYSRMKGAGPMSEVDLNATVTQVLQDLEQPVAERNAEIRRQPLPTVHANPSQMYQLFLNLVSNALKYHNGRRPRVRLGAETDGAGWRLWVKDDGIGIEPEHRASIFNVFQRLHPQHRYAGTGIGLAISKKIVEGHGGRIWVDSSLGKGSTFYVWLPADAA